MSLRQRDFFILTPHRLSQMLTPESRLHRQDSVLMQQAAGSHILLKSDSGECYALDDIGAQIWSLCDGAHRIADIVAAIVADYDAPAATVEADTMELLQELVREQLLLEGP